MDSPKYSFCPKCGGKLEYRIPNEFDPHQRLVCSKCAFIFYQNSKPTTGALITNEKGEVLLVQRAYDPKKGYFDVAGGFLEYGESPEDGCKRELREELNIEIEITDFLAILMDYYDTTQESIICIYYVAKIVSGTPKASSDIAGYQWFLPSEFPKTMAFPSNEEALRLYKEKYAV